MEISRKNYEIFFLDYLDGKLEGKKIDRFLDFIEQNPDLKEELAGIENLKLPEKQIHFDNKKLLYKTGQQKTEDFTAVAYMEGDLSELDRNLFLKHFDFHPEQAKELDLLLRTRLQVDETIVFPAKEKLYRRGFSRQLIYWGSRIAAVLLLAVTFWTVSNFSQQDETILQPEKLVQKQEEPIATKKIIQEEKQEIAEVIVLEQTKNPGSEMKEEETNVASPKIVEPNQTLAMTREPEIVETLRPIIAPLQTVEPVRENVEFAIPATTEEKFLKSKYYTIDSYLAEKVFKIKRKDKSLIESGLNLAGNISGNRIQYETEEGKVSKISFDTRLLAFSIPVKK